MPPELSSSASSFYRRPLPDDLVAFASPAGRQLFREALEAGGMEGWFALAEQFHTQADPAFCGLGTLVVALNALEIDPGRIWKGPWRWYGEALLDCCMPLEEVQKKGMTLDELACLARCNGATARVRRAGEASVAALREAVHAAAAAPRGPVLVAGYARPSLGQTGGGHFSPVAGYHAARDLVLILDVARFKYPPHWVALERLWQAMTDIDPATGRTRGWIVLEKGQQRSMPLFFRLTASEGLASLVAALLREAPGLLATSPAETPEALVAGWVEAIDGRLADQLCRGLSGAPGGPADLPPEHRDAVEVLLGELRATRVHRAIAGSRAGNRPRPVSDEVLATLFLSLPEVALEALPEPARRASAVLRDPALLGPNIAAEVAALREQMTMLRQWQTEA